MQVSPIGIVHSTFCEPEGTPIQAAAAIGSKAIIEVYDEYIGRAKRYRRLFSFDFAISLSSNKEGEINCKAVFG